MRRKWESLTESSGTESVTDSKLPHCAPRTVSALESNDRDREELLTSGEKLCQTSVEERRTNDNVGNRDTSSRHCGNDGRGQIPLDKDRLFRNLADVCRKRTVDEGAMDGRYKAVSAHDTLESVLKSTYSMKVVKAKPHSP